MTARVAAATAFGRAIDARGIRLAWIADQLGVDPSTVTRWRSGERALPPARLQQISSLLARLGVTPDELQEPTP